MLKSRHKNILLSIVGIVASFQIVQAETPVPESVTQLDINCICDRGDGLPVEDWSYSDPFRLEGKNSASDPYQTEQEPFFRNPDAGQRFSGAILIRVRKRFSIRPNGKAFRYTRGEAFFTDSAWIAQRLVEATDLRTGPINQGDLVPIFGELYRVDKCEPIAYDADIRLTRLRRAHWPERIALDPYGYAITPGGYLVLPGVRQARIGPVGCLVRLKFDATTRQYHLVVGHEVPGPRPDGPYDTWKSELPVVDGLCFPVITPTNTYHFKVTSIVLPNPDTHIPGWVEVRRVWPQIQPFGVPSKSDESK